MIYLKPNNSKTINGIKTDVVEIIQWTNIITITLITFKTIAIPNGLVVNPAAGTRSAVSCAWRNTYSITFMITLTLTMYFVECEGEWAVPWSCIFNH